MTSKFVRRLSETSLRTQLSLFMLILLAGTLSASYLISSQIERETLDQVHSYVETLSRALEVSVQLLHLPGESAGASLLRLQTSLEPNQVQQIQLLDSAGRVIASTPTIQPDAAALPYQESVEINVPVIASGELLGYVNIRFLLTSLQGIFRKMLWSKTLISLVIFACGLLIILPAAGLATRSIDGLQKAAHEVAGGNLEVQMPPPTSKEISQLVNSFETMVEKLEGHAELKKELAEKEREAAIGRMASGIAHDLRNPLNYLNLALQQLQHEIETDGEHRPSERLFDGITSELERMKSITQDLLDFGRPVVRSLSTEKASSLLRAAVEDVTRRDTEREVHIQMEDPPEKLVVDVDCGAFERSLVNLLENAVEASGPRQEVRTGCDVSTGDGQPQAVFWIEDSGPGIPAEHLERIFSPYFTTKKSGVGLGLALASKFVQEMGGSIRAENLSGGARFEIVLPVSKEWEPEVT